MDTAARTPSPDDARTIVQGIRLGGSAEIAAAVEAALGPLGADRIEQLVHPDWDRVQFEEYSAEPVSPGAEPVGLARLYPPEQTAADGLTPAWVVAASWYGWLPGRYAGREAALLAYGYVLGHEGGGALEELRDRVARGEDRPIESADLIAFAKH